MDAVTSQACPSKSSRRFHRITRQHIAPNSFVPGPRFHWVPISLPLKFCCCICPSTLTQEALGDIVSQYWDFNVVAPQINGIDEL